MSKNAPQDGGQQMGCMLQRRAPQYLPLLDAEEPFCAWDFELADAEYQKLLEQLKAYGAVRHVDTREKTIMVDRNTRGYSQTTARCKVYRFVPRARDILESEAERTDTLPCGHRAHVLNKGDSFGCKYCEADREYSEETVKSVL